MIEKLQQIVSQHQATYRGVARDSGFHTVHVPARHTLKVLEVLLRDSDFWLDYLISMAGIHRPGTPESIEIHYHLASYPTGFQLHLYTSQILEASGDLAVFDSVSNLWKTAAWHERELGEMYGVRFEGHPYQRNLLLPANWEGFPLRKNYVEQEQYHGVKVKY